MVDDEVIADFGTGFAAKIWKRVYYSPILDYARREGIDFVYMRSFSQCQSVHPPAGEIVETYRRKSGDGNSYLS